MDNSETCSKAGLDLPSVEELKIVEKDLLTKRDNLQHEVDRENRARQKCAESPVFEKLVCEAKVLIEEWLAIQARMKKSAK